MHLFLQFIILAAWGGACWALGDILRQRLAGKEAPDSALLRVPLSFTLGNVAFSYLLTFFGFFRLFQPGLFWMLFAAGNGLLAWKFWSKFIPCSADPFPEQAIKAQPSGRAGLFLAGVLFLFFFPVLLQAAAPPYVRDSLVYHLFCAKEYLREGQILYVPGNLYSAFPKGNELISTLLMAVAGDRAAQGFGILQQMAAIAAVYSLTRMLARPWVAVLCTLGYGTVPPVVYFSGCGYVEPALLMALGHSLLIMAFFSRFGLNRPINPYEAKKSLLLGFIAGWMPALKYTGLIYLTVIALAFLFLYRRSPTGQALKAAGFFAAAAAPGLIWMVWNWVNLGNPLFPMAWGIWGGTGWDMDRARVFSLYFSHFGMGRSLEDYLLLPWRLSFAGRFDTMFFDGAMGPLLLIFLMLLLSSVWLRWRSGIPLGIPGVVWGMFLASALFFLFGTQQARFWLPAQMALAVLAAGAMENILRRGHERPFIKGLFWAAIVAGILWNGWFLGKQWLSVGVHRPVLGMESQRSFLARKVPGYPAMEFMNEHLPNSSRIFCVWTGAYGYWMPRPFYSDTFLEDAEFKRMVQKSADGRDLNRRLRDAGFTHLFIRRSLLENNLEPGQQEKVQGLLTRETKEIFRYGDYVLLVLAGGAEGQEKQPAIGKRGEKG